MKQGYITCAYGKPTYLEQGVNLACSIKRLDKKRYVALLTDHKMQLAATAYRSKGIFDEVYVLEDVRLRGMMCKVACVEVTPFETTLFMDSDCLLVRDPDFLWEKMTSQDFCIQGEVQSEPSTAELCFWFDRFNITYLPVFNGGCFCWNRKGADVISRAGEILRNSRENRIPRGVGGCDDDQPAIGIAMAERGIKPLPNSLNLHFSTYGSVNLQLDLEKNYCGFLKGTYWAEPCVLHYNSLAGVEMYRSKSRKVLEREVAKLRRSFGLPDCPWPKPDLRTFLWLVKTGQFHLRDNR
jgi:hypothetical protein